MSPKVSLSFWGVVNKKKHLDIVKYNTEIWIYFKNVNIPKRFVFWFLHFYHVVKTMKTWLEGNSAASLS